MNRSRLIVAFTLVAVLMIIALLAFSAGRLFSRQREPGVAIATTAPLAASPAPALPTATALVATTASPSATPVLAEPTDTLSLPTSTSVLVQLTPTRSPTIIHEVLEGETVFALAVRYGIEQSAIIQANDLVDPYIIQPGQTLAIPLGNEQISTAATSTPSTEKATTTASQESAEATTSSSPDNNAEAEPSGPAAWPPSLISGDIASNYPLTTGPTANNLLIHYQPDTYPARNISALTPIIDQIFADLQREMGGSINRQVDVYLAGTLFATNPALQGFTQSYEFRTFVLANGVFDDGERDYILGHELTHIAATHILGPASSTMIHEGLATYLPQRYLNAAGYLPLEQICAAAYQTDAFRSAQQLSRLAYGADAFGGHIRTFFNYNLSGCFVGYLVENYGMEKLDEVYDSGDYYGVYGSTLGELDQAWQASLATTPLTINPEEYVSAVSTVAEAYDSYVSASPGGQHANYEAYLALNRARLAANRGRLGEAQTELDAFWALMGG